MTLTLILKEVRQHWGAFLALGLLVVLILAVIAAGALFRGLSATVLEAICGVLMILVPLAGAFISGRLFVAEYRAKTQLFLEALPLSRARMVAVKFVLGLAVIWFLTAMIILTAAGLSARHDVLNARFIAILLARGLAFALFWHTFFFATGLLGRYRWPIFILLAISLFCVDKLTALDIEKFAVLELLGEQFAHEREAFPMADLRITFGCAAALTGLGAVLALVNEGSVSALLAEKMSHREKVSVAVVILGAVVAMSVIEEKHPGAPFDLPGASEARRNGVVVKVAGEGASAASLAEFVAGELDAVREFLGIAEWPEVFISERADLDADKFERARADAKRGFLVRANHADRLFERKRFLAWLVGELLDHRSHERTCFEPYRWVRDGIGDFCVRSDNDALHELTLRALHGTAGTPPSRKTFEHWLLVREQVGDGVARGMAFSALKTLERHRGKESCQEFLRSVLGPETPHNFAATLRDWRDSVSARLHRTTMLDEAALAALWRDDLASERARLSSELAALPRVALDTRLVAESAQSIAVEYTVVTTTSPAPAPVRVRYDTLPPLDLDTEEPELREETHLSGEPGPHRLPESFQRGSRVVIGAAVRVPALGCDVISGWRRLTLHPEERAR